MQGGTVVGNLYGGGALANTNIANVTTGYGTANETTPSTSAHTTTVNLHGGTVGGAVFGGGLGRKAKAAAGGQAAVTAVEAMVYGDVTVKLNETASDACKVLTVFGSNNYNGTPKGNVTVHVYRTVAYDATHKKPTEPDGNGGDIPVKNNTTYDVTAVYGGGNEAAYVPLGDASRTNVVIEGCDDTSIQYVYGGGNAAPVPATHVTVNSCYEIYSVFGGGNGFDNLQDGTPNPGANVGYKTYTTEQEKATAGYGTGNSTVEIFGGTVHNAFGGSNTKGNVRGEASVTLVESDVCPLVIDEVYGAGNKAEQDGPASINLGCLTYLDEIYGGSREAHINGDVVLTIQSGRFNKVFGGNNVGGTVNGSITVNIEQTGCLPIEIGELYLGGNQASYSVYGYREENGVPVARTSDTDGVAIKTPTAPWSTTQFYKDPVVNIRSAKSIGSVFGGGLKAVVVGNPTVNVNMVGGWVNGEYGGSTGENAKYNLKANGVPVKTLLKDIAGDGTVIGSIGTVFGGGNEGEIIGNTSVNIGTEKSVRMESVRDGDDKPASITLESKTEGEGVNARTTYWLPVKGANITGNVYGGGNAANVTGSTSVIIGAQKEDWIS